MHSRWRRTAHTISALALLLVIGLVLAACGTQDSDASGAGGTKSPSDATEAAAETATSYALIPTNPYQPLLPTVTPGGIPWGETGTFIEGAIVLEGGMTVTREFRYPQYGNTEVMTCAGTVEGKSRDDARDETEQIFYEMDAYLHLPNPGNDPSTDFATTDAVWASFRVMPYDGPGIYDDVAMFGRGTEHDISDDDAVPDIGFMPIPYLTVGNPEVATYNSIGPDTTIVATVNVDGSGELRFANLYQSADPSAIPLSGTMTWSCTEHAPDDGRGG